MHSVSRLITLGYRICVGIFVASNQSLLPERRVTVPTTRLAADGPEATSRDATWNRPGLIRQRTILLHAFSLCLLSSSW